MKWAYYNEWDKPTAAWLRELIKANLIAPGEVDERSIQDVKGEELREFRQCHFFAGIGGWAYALRLAGWPDDKPVWTGSCPCQPFSIAGKGLGEKDERHLWPEFLRLIHQCRPTIIFGEQVCSVEVIGKEQREGCGVSEKVSLPESCERFNETCAGASDEEENEIRPRSVFARIASAYRQRRMRDFRSAFKFKWWKNMGQSVIRPNNAQLGLSLFEYSDCTTRTEQRDGGLGGVEDAGNSQGDNGSPVERLERAFRTARAEIDEATVKIWLSGVRIDLEEIGYRVGACDLPAAGVGSPHPRQRLYWVANSGHKSARRTTASKEKEGRGSLGDSPGCGKLLFGMGDSDERGLGAGSEQPIRLAEQTGIGLVNPILPGLEGHTGDGHNGNEPGWLGEKSNGSIAKAGPWSDWELCYFTDGKVRRIESGTKPVANGVPARVVRLRGYGNAIVPEVASEFIQSYLETK